MKVYMHASAPDTDYTLCGLPPEHCDDGECVELAKPGEKITCPSCLYFITFCKSIKRSIQP